MAADALNADFPQALPVELHPNIDHIVTEDDTPVDNVFSEKQQRLLTEALYASWSGPGPRAALLSLWPTSAFSTTSPRAGRLWCRTCC